MSAQRSFSLPPDSGLPDQSEDLVQENSQLKKANYRLKLRLKDLEETCDEQADAIQNLDTQLDTLKDKYRSSHGDTKLRQIQLQEERAEREKVQTDLTATQAALKQAQVDIKDLQTQKRQTDSTNTELHAKLQTLASKLDKTVRDSEVCIEEIDELRAENDTLREQYNSTVTQLTELGKQHTQISGDIDKVTKDKADLQGQLEACHIVIDQQKQSLASTHQAVIDRDLLKVEITKLSKTLDRAQVALDDARQGREDLKRELQAQKDDLQKTKQTEQHLQLALDHLTKERTTDHEESQSVINHFVDENKVLAIELADTQEQLDEEKSRIQNVLENLVQKHTTVLNSVYQTNPKTDTSEAEHWVDLATEYLQNLKGGSRPRTRAKRRNPSADKIAKDLQLYQFTFENSSDSNGFIDDKIAQFLKPEEDSPHPESTAADELRTSSTSTDSPVEPVEQESENPDNSFLVLIPEEYFEDMAAPQPPNNNYRADPDDQTRPADQWRCCPKYLDGSDPLVHLRKFEDFMRLLNIDNAQASVWFEKTLEGAAQQWWSFLTPAQREMTTGPQWEAFKLLFRKQFSPGGATREQQESAWEYLAWDGNLNTLQRFAYNLKSVAEGLGYGEAEQVSKFKKCVGRVHTYLIPSLMATDTLLAALNLAIKTIAACGTVNAPIPQVAPVPPTGQVAANMPFLHAKTISFDNEYQDEMIRSLDKLGKNLKVYSERMEDIQQSGLDRIYRAIDSTRESRRPRSTSRGRRNSRGRPNSRGRNARGDSVHFSRYASSSRERENGRGRRQSQSPGRGGRGRSDSRGRRARSPFYDQRHCNYCDKIGHTYKFCNKMREDLVRIKRLTETNDAEKVESLNLMTKDRDVLEFMQAMMSLN